MTLCIIPARGNSRRIPNKNLKLFHGKPIIQYSIEAAKGAGWDVIVSTDDQGIANFADFLKTDVHFRHWDDPDGEVGTQEVVGRTLRKLDIAVHDYVCCLYATAPAVTTQVLDWAENSFHQSQCWWLVGSYPHRLEDCGAFYIGHAEGFMRGDPLIEWTTEAFPIHNHIDINTPEDWDRYEKLYEEMK